jgi:ribosomal peptide maturation radical SAM protein 1
MTDVLLINMPFSNARLPSIALGLLKASLTRKSIPCDVLYFNLRFAEAIGLPFYGAIENQSYPEHLIGEWIFSGALFSQEKSDSSSAYIEQIVGANRVDVPGQPMYPGAILEQVTLAIHKSQEVVAEFLEACLEKIVAHQPKIVGFTSVFEQHLASLALAKMIKARLPECFIVFGGSNCEGSMGQETFRQFTFIDALVSGEGDFVFSQIVSSVLNGKRVPETSGLYLRQSAFLRVVDQVPQNTPIVHELDDLPIPDYDDYFEQLTATGLKVDTPILLFETSRGCWWGEKQHCTFCGLNGATMVFRSKSAQRAIDELTYLTDRHPGCAVNAVDNILDMKYFGTFITALAEKRHDFGLFYEVKSNLKKHQLEMLHAAGVKKIQPGIESLSDAVLRIMRKGVTALQNVQLLKWCAELGIDPCYNLIWGFPGETADDYREMNELIPLIQHLRAPEGAGIIRIDRFSPNFNDSVALGFGSVIPVPAYQWVYPFAADVLANLAYFFIPSNDEPYFDTTASKDLSDRIRSWKDLAGRSELFFLDKDSQLLIWDFRTDAKERLVVLDECDRFLYLACDEVKSPGQVLNAWLGTSSLSLKESDIRNRLDSFVSRGLMITQLDHYLSLAYRKALPT